MRRFIHLLTVAAAVICAAASVQAQTTKYWDINGANAGGTDDVSGFGDGTWDTTTPNWNTDPTGASPTTTWTDGDIAVFSAGTNVLDTALTFAGPPRTVGGLEVQEGRLIIGTSAAITIGTNPAKIDQGATLQINNLNVLTATSGHVLTIDGGTLRNTIIGVGSGIYTNPSSLGRIEMTANGATFDTPNGGGIGANDTASSAYSILLYSGFVGLQTGVTSGTLHKKGHGEFRGLNNWTFTALDVQEGLYRINGTGGGDTGFGAATGTVTAAGGANPNTTEGAALGTSIGITSPATRSFVLSGVGATPDTMFVINAGWTINGNISGPGGLMLNGWNRTDGGPATGTSVIGSQTQLLTLGGTNTYGGKTTINFGTLVVTGGSAIPNTSQVAISTQSVWGGNNGQAASTLNTAVLQIGTSAAAATETIGSLSGGNGTRGSVSLPNAASQLITGADNSSTTFSGSIAGAGSLKKIGSGTFTIDGTKTYTGNTEVAAGTLSTNSASLADAADVLLTHGSIFNLNFVGSDTIRSLFIDGVGQAAGTWGGAGSGAANITPLITGTGLLNVTLAPGLAGDYNGDGKVDAADYVTWRKDPAGHGGDPAGYTTWRNNFGLPGAGSGLGAGAVPEPATLMFGVFGLVSGLLIRRRRG